MMETPPSSPLIVAKSEFLLEVLVVALDPPAQLGGIHKIAAARCCGQRGQNIFGRFGFVGRPFDQAPFLGARRRTLVIAMCGANAHGGKRDASLVLVPSRQVTRRQAFLGSPSANCLAETG